MKSLKNFENSFYFRSVLLRLNLGPSIYVIFSLHSISLSFVTYFQQAYRKVGPGTRDLYRWNPGNREPKISRWDPGPGTPKVESGIGDPKYLSVTRDFLTQFSIVLIVYSTLNTSHFTCYKTLH